MTSGNVGSPSRGSLVVLSGYPGSGKTTFAQALQIRLPALHLESDEIRKGISPQPRYTAAEHAVVFDRIERRADAALRAGRSVIIDATNLTERDRSRFLRLADRLAVRSVAIRISAPDHTIRARLAGPREGHSDASVPVYEAMRLRAEPARSAVIVVDTRFPLEPAIDLVLRLLEDVPE